MRTSRSEEVFARIDAAAVRIRRSGGMIPIKSPRGRSKRCESGGPCGERDPRARWRAISCARSDSPREVDRLRGGSDRRKPGVRSAFLGYTRPSGLPRQHLYFGQRRGRPRHRRCSVRIQYGDIVKARHRCFQGRLGGRHGRHGAGGMIDERDVAKLLAVTEKRAERGDTVTPAAGQTAAPADLCAAIEDVAIVKPRFQRGAGVCRPRCRAQVARGAAGAELRQRTEWPEDSKPA